MNKYTEAVDEIKRLATKGDTETAKIQALLLIADRLDRLCEIRSSSR